jgi:hypothetical protein
LPSCFVQRSPIVSRLSRATCTEGQTCTPCFNPLTGDSTGACEHAGDAPTEAPLTGFAECADNTGYCLPAFAAGNSAAQLSRLTCAEGELCAPKVKVADPSACFSRCDGGALGPGACVPQFLTAQLGSLLMRASCAVGELCAPCDALGNHTGVCD